MAFVPTHARNTARREIAVNKTTTNIFDSHDLARLELPNRIVIAPLTRSRAANDIAGGMNALYYTQRTDVFPTSSH
jgi:hypothetical protein